MTALTLTRGNDRGDLVVGYGADWEVAVSDWLRNLKSDRTRQTYTEAWRDFVGFCGKLPDQVSQSDCIAYKSHLKTDVSPKTGKPFAQSTVNLRLSALSSFFDFAVERKLRPDNPVNGVKREAVSPYGKATFLDVEAGEDIAFLDQIDPSTEQGKRDYAIFLLYLTGGFRVSEVATMTVGDLRRQGRRMFVTYRRKGGITEETVLADEAAEALDDYLDTRQGLAPKSPLFVAGEKGKAAARAIGRYGDDEKPLSPRAIRYLVKTYADKVFGAGHGIRPHSLRHTAAQALLTEGGTLAEVSRLLKHSNVGITTIYLHSTVKSDGKTAAVLGRRYGRRGLLASD